jgi:hypothetical protein
LKDGIVAFAGVGTELIEGCLEIWDYSKYWGWTAENNRLMAGDTVLVDDVNLCGGFRVRLTKERREWLSGRYMNCNWDVDELGKMRDEIVEREKLKFIIGCLTL